MHYSPTEAFRACERIVRLRAPLYLRIGAVDEAKPERKQIVSMRHVTEAEKAGMRAAYARGDNYNKIAADFGVSSKTAAKHAKSKADGKL